ncbi:MAG: Glu-tRNA(Gln) amidotransferase subunit GatE [Candidatus Nanoarchaeia archaeon]
MAALDYKKIGLKCGIEIHQQLKGKKLFCDCPTSIVDDHKYEVEITRKLRAVIGETGEIDQAALHESRKGKYYIYRAESGSSCLVELDEEPPHQMNRQALDTALQVALVLKAKIVDEVQIMRKTVVDGSNTSGFQRTALVAQGGSLETSFGKVDVPTICIEEDAAKIVKRNEEYDIYNLSKLGIPLVEIATDPDIHSPEQCKETSEKIGMILRSTGKVKRGIGTIRQDVNVSIKGGDRIEIKGAQDLKAIPLWVENEAKRQIALLEIRKTLGKVKIDGKIHDISQVLKKCDSKIIKSTFEKNGVIKAIKLDGFAGIIGKETQPGKRLGSEFSDYAKVKAGVGGLFHSDELPKYGITDKDVENIRKELKCKEKDAFVLIADKEEKVDQALEEVIKRVKMCEQGVIREVRKPNPDGTTSYMRPMPGADRMYPETDTLPLKADIKNIKIPEMIQVKAERFVKKLGLGKDLADVAARSGKGDTFEGLVKSFNNIKPAFIAETVFSMPKTLRRDHDIDDSVLTDADFKDIFARLDRKEITKDAIEEILIKVCKKEKIDYRNYAPLSEKDLEKELKKIIAENKGAPMGAIMGKAMAHFRGKADGRKISELLKKYSK